METEEKLCKMCNEKLRYIVDVANPRGFMEKMFTCDNCHTNTFEKVIP